MTEQSNESMENHTFAELQVAPNILRGIEDLGYEKPLPIQVACIEPIRQGHHVSLRSKTGTGKTAAFGIPILETLDPQAAEPRALLMAPTRELAVQIGQELSALGRHGSIRIVTAVGGASIRQQIKELKDGAQVVVGTPGRLLDLWRQKKLDLRSVRVVVLDEADEMLSMGFFEDVTGLVDACVDRRQVIVASASLDNQTAGLIQRYAPDPVRIDLSADSLSVDLIDNVYYVVKDELPKHHYLLLLLKAEQPASAIVFVNTRSDADLLATQMAREGWQAEMISAELSQTERQRVMTAIREGKLRFLVATDVAARGIDISHLSHVINYSLPEDPSVYLHRVGRTGRVGRKGTAISLLTGRHLRTLGVLERRFGIRFAEREFPGVKDMVNERSQGQIGKLMEEAENAICDGFLSQAEAVREHSQAVLVIAYLLKRNADKVHDEQRSADNRPARKQKPVGDRNPRRRRRR